MHGSIGRLVRLVNMSLVSGHARPMAAWWASARGATHPAAVGTRLRELLAQLGEAYQRCLQRRVGAQWRAAT